MTAEPLDKLVAKHPFCKGLPPDAVALITGCAENVRYDRGAILFRDGEEADSTYLIRAGRVALDVHGVEAAETAEEGDIMGWSWLFPPYKWHFTARAVTPVRAFRLDGTCLRNKCEADPAFGYEITRRMLYQVHRRLERSRLHRMDVYGGTETP